MGSPFPKPPSILGFEYLMYRMPLLSGAGSLRKLQNKHLVDAHLHFLGRKYGDIHLGLFSLHLAFSLRPRQPHPLQSQTGGLLNRLGGWGDRGVWTFGAVQGLSLVP